MQIDYSKYHLEDLLDVKENIDAQMYPERYQHLCEEIELRRKKGEFDELELDEDDDDDEEDDFFIEFSSQGSGTGRKLFICAFLLVNLAILAFIIPKYMVSEIKDIHKYTTTIDSVECHKEELIDEETDRVSTFFDLHIGVQQDSFSAMGISQSRCNKIARDLAAGSEVSIWHEDGLIHQLASGNKNLLSYAYMKPKVRKLRAEKVEIFWLSLLALWILPFKSLANAVAPGTFVSDKED